MRGIVVDVVSKMTHNFVVATMLDSFDAVSITETTSDGGPLLVVFARFADV